jgi:hypothetical protein
MRRRPLDYPRYVQQRRLSWGGVAYYWVPHPKFRKAGFPLPPEPLGTDYAAAIKRAEYLNAHLDAWRGGSDKDERTRARYGTLDWLVDVYLKSKAYERVGERSRKGYLKSLALILDYVTQAGDRLGTYGVGLFEAEHADKLYVALRDRHGIRTANFSFTVMARAWAVASRLKKDVPLRNPWRGVDRDKSTGTTRPCSRAEAYALAYALRDAGHPLLGAIPIICFEFHQRPENVIAHFTRDDYRPAERPDCIRIKHHKTGALVWIPLRDGGRSLFPEAEAYFDGLTWDGPLVTTGKRWVLSLVLKARKAAGLPEYVTLAACRHGGMTELGDAGLTEQGVMALSGHKTPQAARLYVKKTERQRLEAARKRRSYVGD